MKTAVEIDKEDRWTSLRWINNILNELAKNDYTGKVEVNFFRGGISNVNKVESLKPPKSL